MDRQAVTGPDIAPAEMRPLPLCVGIQTLRRGLVVVRQGPSDWPPVFETRSGKRMGNVSGFEDRPRARRSAGGKKSPTFESVSFISPMPGLGCPACDTIRWPW
jgi:hypothetical protein